MAVALPSQKTDITLYRGWLDHGKHVWSPFVIKLEARLRFAGVSYKTDAGSPRTAPTGKIPYIECCPSSPGKGNEEPFTMGDSTLIVKALTERELLPDLNAVISPAQRAEDLALRALLEDKLYFYSMRERWIDNYYAQREHILWALPWAVRVLVGSLIYRTTLKTLHGQGTGRYTGPEILAFKREIWEAVNGLLIASKAKSRPTGEPFWVLGGESPTEADGTVFGFIVSVLISTASPESKEVVKGFPTLLEYVSRIHDKYFPDYDKW